MRKHFIRGESKDGMGIQILFFTSFFFFGLFKEYAACIYTGILCGFFYAAFRKKHVQLYINMESVMLFLLSLLYLLTAIWGVDFGMSLIGAARMMGVLVFMLISMQIDDLQRKKLLLCIPAAGVSMTIIGMLALPFPVLRDFFWTDSQRLGGFFQYPNVFALICLLGFLVLADQTNTKADRKKELLHLSFMLLLLLGILLSGSRSVFFLTAGAVICTAVFDKRNRKKAAALFMLSILFAVGYVMLSGNMLNIGRFLTASFSSSTLLGRLIYAQDALRVLRNHPFGLGYLGYYYMEPAIQTAVYSVRFVHNDILQIALDVGILPSLLFAIAVVKNLYAKRNSLYECLMLAVMCLHLLLDFDLEFMSVWYVLVLLLCLVQGNKIAIRPGTMKKIMHGIVLACGAVSIYFGAAMLPRYLSDPEFCLMAIPFYTEAGKEVLAKEEDMEKAVHIADKLIAQNAYIAEAYDIKAIEAFQKQRYGDMLSFKQRSLALQKYDMNAYNRYIALLGQALSDVADIGDEDVALDILYAIAEIEHILEDVKAQTNPLAYQTRDAPELTLDSQAADYIIRVKEVLGDEW